MLGISWRRQQGLADALLKRMLSERGLDTVPQWTKEGDVRMRANRRWTALAEDRDGAVARQRCEIPDIAATTADINAEARALGADLVGCCALSPIMIGRGVGTPSSPNTNTTARRVSLCIASPRAPSPAC